MDDAAVVAGLVAADLDVALQDRQGRVGTASVQLAGHRQTQDSAPDDGQVAEAGA
jgi:hypothetical protein